MDCLAGVKVVEIVGLAPVPFCGQILADFGADVTLVEKTNSPSAIEQRLIRGKRIISLDFKSDLSKLRRLIANADVLLDPYRPGVLEAMGLDPVDLIHQNPKLIVARITGYGQTGPLARRGGHDINYVAMSGVLPRISGTKKPVWPPANLMADFAGGALTAAFGVCAALVRRGRTGQGGVVDVSMAEGVMYLASQIFAYADVNSFWDKDVGLFSGNSPIFRTYETSDGKFMAVGALEPKFHNKLFEVLNIDPGSFSGYKELTKKLESIFRSKTRSEWTSIFKDVDACVTPVLDLKEARDLQQHVHRNVFAHPKALPAAAPRIYSADEFRKLRSKL